MEHLSTIVFEDGRRCPFISLPLNEDDNPLLTLEEQMNRLSMGYRKPEYSGCSMEILEGREVKSNMRQWREGSIAQKNIER